uniref:Uncharacterized protein n=1 Tax=Rhizophora mucronata TaxID=61149 RepID=A0A2P2PM17_RHIMU
MLWPRPPEYESLECEGEVM